MRYRVVSCWPCTIRIREPCQGSLTKIWYILRKKIWIESIWSSWWSFGKVLRSPIAHSFSSSSSIVVALHFLLPPPRDCEPPTPDPLSGCACKWVWLRHHADRAGPRQWAPTIASSAPSHCLPRFFRSPFVLDPTQMVVARLATVRQSSIVIVPHGPGCVMPFLAHIVLVRYMHLYWHAGSGSIPSTVWLDRSCHSQTAHVVPRPWTAHAGPSGHEKTNPIWQLIGWFDKLIVILMFI